MRFGVRILLGAILGLVALVTLWLLGVRTWVVATTAGLLAPIGFLGSFFVWSADRPEAGYEQVLLDAPNTTLSVVMIVLFAGASFGLGFIHFGHGPAAPDEKSQLQQMALGVQVHVKDFNAGKIKADDVTAYVATTKAAAKNLTLANAALKDAATGLDKSLDDLAKCAAAGANDGACLDARIDASDVLSKLK